MMTASLCAGSSWFAALEQLSVGQQCVVYQPGGIFTQELNGKSWLQEESWPSLLGALPVTS